MLYLQDYIRRENHLRKVFGESLLETPTDFEEARPIFQKLAADLSPENLNRDGEASRQEADNRFRMLKGAWAELETICGRTVTEDELYA